MLTLFLRNGDVSILLTSLLQNGLMTLRKELSNSRKSATAQTLVERVASGSEVYYSLRLS